MNAGSPITDDSRKEETEKIISACAEACGVGRELVDKICLASEEQKYRMDHHIETGSSYMMQMVLHHEGNLNQDFLLRVLSAMRLKNHILRTRLINYEGYVYQLVLKDTIVCQQLEADLHGFLAHDSQTRMDYGTPLFRYAFIKEPRGEAFFIWTSEPLQGKHPYPFSSPSSNNLSILSVHCCVVDAWTLRLIFDDFQTACSDLRAYDNLVQRPPFGRYVRWLEIQTAEAGYKYWFTRHVTFKNLVHNIQIPVLALGGTPSASTRRAKKLLHLPKNENVDFKLHAMGHGAWALTLANILTPENPPLVSEDLSFISLNPARVSNVPGIKHIMGPISARVPIRIRFFPDMSIGKFLYGIQTQLSCMIGFEHCAMKALSSGVGFQNMLKQAVFSWNPHECDITSKRVVCHDKEAAPAVLAYREDLSVPFTHDYVLMFEVYEHDGHITIYATWDHNLVFDDFIDRLFDDFGSFLALIIKERDATVVELLSKHRMAKSEPEQDVAPNRTGVDDKGKSKGR